MYSNMSLNANNNPTKHMFLKLDFYFQKGESMKQKKKREKIFNSEPIENCSISSFDTSFTSTSSSNSLNFSKSIQLMHECFEKLSDLSEEKIKEKVKNLNKRKTTTTMTSFVDNL